MRAERSVLRRYAVCFVAMGVAIAGRAWAERMGWGAYRFPFVQLGVIVSAALGGVGPGMLAVILGSLAWGLFLPPVGRFWIAQPVDLLNLVTFAGVNVLIVFGFATARQRWAARSKPRGGLSEDAPPTNPARPQAAPAQPRPHLLLQSPGALAVLLAVVAAMAAFGCWGTFSAAGTARFDDETTLIPLTCLGLAPAILIFGIGFLPVFSFHTPNPPHGASAR